MRSDPSPASAGEPLDRALLVPERRPGSVRRTSSTDILRPEGSLGPLLLRGRGRDLVTAPTGDGAVVAQATLEARISGAGAIESLRLEPDDARGAALVGTRLRSGLRGVLAAALPEQRDAQTLLHLLLDELPVAAVISGYAVVRDPRAADALRASAGGIRADVCAGWRSDGAIARGEGDTVPLGRPAQSLARPGDPLAWHALEPLPPGAMRRRRRLDVTPGPAIALDAMLRDTFCEPDGRETIVHEYHVTAALDPRDQRVLALQATPGVLPGFDCRAAVHSTAQIPALPAATLREHVSAKLRGPTTCTHLNDVFRSLSDAAALLRCLAR